MAVNLLYDELLELRNTKNANYSKHTSATSLYEREDLRSLGKVCFSSAERRFPLLAIKLF